MKIHGVKQEWSHPIFCIKKHYCPYCNELLEKAKTETIVNSESDGGTYFGKPNNGTDWCFIKKITDKWYYYELHWA